VWYELGRRRAEAEGRTPSESYALKMVGELERVVQDELPQVATALRACGVPLASFMLRWLRQSYLGVLSIDECCRRVALLLPRGVEYDVYFAASILRHLSPQLTPLVAAGDDTAVWRLLRARAVEGFVSEEHGQWIEGLSKRHGGRIRGGLAGF